jgi:hypothetical protein
MRSIRKMLAVAMACGVVLAAPSAAFGQPKDQNREDCGSYIRDESAFKACCERNGGQYWSKQYRDAQGHVITQSGCSYPTPGGPMK